MCMDKDKIQKLWKAIRTIIEVLIAFFCGTQAETWLGGPLW